MAGIDSLMATELITAREDETIAVAAHRMSVNHIGALLIVDGGRLTGLLSERDVLGRVVAEGRDPQMTKIGTVCSRDLVTVDADQPLKAVLDIFREGNVRHLPVLRKGLPVGILSTRDFHAFLVEGFEEFVDQLKYERTLDEGFDPYDHFGGPYGR
jgi:CBS domain-containing protein